MRDSPEIAAFIDAVAEDQTRAEQMLDAAPHLLNARWLYEETVLHFLTVESCVDGVRWLAEHGAEIDATNKFGDTALIDAAVLGNAPMVRLLLSYGANPNAPSENHGNPLGSALSKSVEVVDLLLAAGAKSESLDDLSPEFLPFVVPDPDKREQLIQVFAKHGLIIPR